MYRCVLWDLDGTIADTSLGVINAVKYASEKMDLPRLENDEYKLFIGPPNIVSYSTHFRLSDIELMQAIEYHKEYAREKGAQEAILYLGIKQLLERLRKYGIIQSVCTLKNIVSAEAALKHLGIYSFFNLIVGSNDNVHDKEGIIQYAINKLKINCTDCVLVGDSIYDQQASEKCGIDFIAVTYGFGYKSDIDIYGDNVIGIADTVEQIESYILGGLAENTETRPIEQGEIFR